MVEAPARPGHVVIVDSNRVGLRCIERARALGHRTTFLFGRAFRMYAEDADCQRLMAAANTLVPLPTTFEVEPVLGALQDILDHDVVDALVCPLDEAVPAAAAAAEMLHIPFTARAAVDCARDKLRCRERLAACGVPSPSFAAVEGEEASLAAAKSIGFPAVVKPRIGGSSRWVQMVRDEEGFGITGAICPRRWRRRIRRSVGSVLPASSSNDI